MELEKYKLIFSGKTQSEISFNLEWISGTKQAMEQTNRKLYVIKQGEKFLYVGEANCTIVTRLRRGFTSYRYFVKNGIGRGGYQGYKWIKLSDSKLRPELSIYVHVFAEKHANFRGFVEAIEGELVYLIRKETQQWPVFQNEIHFNNESGSREIAEELFAKMKIS